ncbi:hypothetical protein [Tessaracoccus caeni]|uniref:hypothetical protein n=1 Tax=Tessaracoccus caeni TaxID=3031239 RepID=UPI0023DC05C6|nr:hypothetical protein [Tessaracoccus caeni]
MEDLSATQEVTTGQESSDVIDSILMFRERNLKRTGVMVYRDVVISEPVTNKDGVTTAIIEHCRDNRLTKAVDIDTGKEDEGRLTGTAKVEVLMEKLPDGSWRAALVKAEMAPC